VSDRTFLNCHVYDCPDSEQAAAREALGEWGPWGEYVHDPESPLDGLTTLPDVTCDTTPDIAAALRKAAPGASWITWEEPGTAGPGRAIAYTPTLGEHDGECDASGDMLVSRSSFAALRAQHAGAALIAAIDAALGGPWARDYAARVAAEPDDEDRARRRGAHPQPAPGTRAHAIARKTSQPAPAMSQAAPTLGRASEAGPRRNRADAAYGALAGTVTAEITGSYRRGFAAAAAGNAPLDDPHAHESGNSVMRAAEAYAAEAVHAARPHWTKMFGPVVTCDHTDLHDRREPELG
jgi:hypothetical protein